MYTVCDIHQEALAQKTDSSLFMFGSHSKKRPNNVVLGVYFVFVLQGEVCRFIVSRFSLLKV